MGYAKYHEDNRELREDRMRYKKGWEWDKQKNKKAANPASKKKQASFIPYNGIRTCYGCW